MYLLYLDESGNPDSPDDRHFVLGGAAIFERVTFHLGKALDEIQTRYLPGIEPVDFHATEIRSGKGFWRRIEKEKRDAILHDIVEVVANANRGMVLFAAAIEKSTDLHGEDAVKRATEEVSRRFDIFLRRQRVEDGESQRGLIIFAESALQKRQRIWVHQFRKLGTQWGTLRSLSDIPYFASPKETRLLQIADLVAHAVFMLYERDDDSLLSPLLRRFDQKDGVLHGLYHLTPKRSTCACPRCASERRARATSIGPPPGVTPPPDGDAAP